MVTAAKRHRELVADLATERTRLRKPKMMRIRGLTPADQTGLGTHELQMIPIPQPERLAQGVCGLSSDR
jgi:hypothetical protein